MNAWRKYKTGHRRKHGVTLIELLITIGLIAVTWTVIDASFRGGFLALANSRARVAATAVANEKLEIIRNMSYDSVGTTAGWPSGALPSSQTVQESGFDFTVLQRVDFIDDPFDGDLLGSIPGKPVDTAPNDYKRAQITVTWKKVSSISVVLSSLVAPRGVEAATNTGSFIIRVFDSSGVGVPQANVHIQNSATTPAIDIANTTDNSGNLQVISLPPAIGTYKVTVSKSGYSTEQTYSTSELTNPVRQNLSIILNQVTQASFAIDRVSTLAISTLGQNCTAIGNVPLSIYGQKLIATSPDVRKFSSNPPTGANGLLTLANLEWDNYTLIETSPTYDVSGIIPPIFLNILPNTSQSVGLVLAPSTPHSLLVTVKNATSGNTVTAANVRLFKTGYDQANLTGVGFFSQTSWSGGSGQALLTDLTRYATDDGNVDISANPGNVQLRASTSQTVTTEDFSTTTKRDEIATTADWNTDSGRLQLPLDKEQYPESAVGQSLKLNTDDGKITKATLNVTAQENGQQITYALSADGGLTFESVVPGLEHVFASAGSDLRFRASLATKDTGVTPVIDSLSVTSTIIAYAATGTLTSSTFDTGTDTTETRTISWNPSSQAPGVGADSVRFQVAGNNNNTTWNYVGPDGTSGTYFIMPGTDLPASLDGQRYLRYQLFLQTGDPTVTPGLSDVAIGFTSGCIPPGQVFFSGLGATTYTLEVSASGFMTYSNSVSINGPTRQEVLLTPN